MEYYRQFGSTRLNKPSSQRMPSTPIAIPTRHKQNKSPPFTPVQRPTSPELIFEMSPLDFPAPTHPFSYRISQPEENEKFLYHFPIFSGCHSRARPQTHTTLSTSTVCSTPPGTFQCHDGEHPRASLNQAHHASRSSTCRHKKITGFIPQNPGLPSPPTSGPPPGVKRLSPSNLSFSTPAWIFPGGQDHEDVEDSEHDPLDFENYLIQCIENEKALGCGKVKNMPRLSLCK